MQHDSTKYPEFGFSRPGVWNAFFCDLISWN